MSTSAQRRTGRLLTGAAMSLAVVLSACSSNSGSGESDGRDGSESGAASARSDSGSSAARSTSSSAPGAGSPEVVATGLEAPWSIAFFGQTMLVSERDSGRILEVSAGRDVREVGQIEDASASGEAGLHGLAVDDDRLYAFFAAGTENRIVRFDILGEAGELSLSEEETILDGLPTANFHNGGRLAFGPDGLLYATLGDTGDRDSAQDEKALSGKILRMTPDGDIPADNPFGDSLVFSMGHRNPQGIGWDDEGTMYASEFGQDTWDELNVIDAGGNYGWPEVEGIAEDSGPADDGGSGDGSGDFIDPVQQWSPDEASPSGLAVTDESILIAGLRGERLHQVPLDDLSASNELWAGEHGRLRDVVEAPNGSLLVLTNNTDGRGEPGPDDDRLLRFTP
ncbi:Glucose/arabinose dehydrogenase, beta-propeller fold [Brevibacterium siliguriense]|uniref:Glucose/arabinose dehydrogenase, beta-propeller fold n=1 Tax=Brevibacterium siliguriense TaxID=1136497 RepID=A0A1H1LFQ3_9MICO|nr:PQQ-dependent sugar dehydrogenase [Brevibacterium siliguriense]SDR73140.1 Glucose/arabinose dehydrogenase, beta-propeller fold [Brevibacterium siliguriense]